MGRAFGWLWAAFAVSSFGTWLAFDAFPLIAVLVLDASPAQVSVLAAAGLAVGALVAVPFGPWVEFRRKRPVMVAMDLVRCAALLTVPLAYAFGLLTFVQLVVVSVVVATADIAFTAASGACLKALLPREKLLAANGRFEMTTWTATMVGPPLGGVAIAVLGPVTTVAVNAVSFLLSALGVRAMGGDESPPPRPATRTGLTARELLGGWRFLLGHAALRPLFLNTLVVNGLIMAQAPPLAVLMLGGLHFAPWQYGLAFAVPCAGGLIGSRIARPLAARYGRRRVMVVAGTARVCWPVGLAFVHAGPSGLLLFMAVEFGLITCAAVFTPVVSTYRLEQAPPDRVARTLSAWTVSGKATTAAFTAVWGLLAALAGPRAAVAVAGLLALATPLLLIGLRADAVEVAAEVAAETTSAPAAEPTTAATPETVPEPTTEAVIGSVPETPTAPTTAATPETAPETVPEPTTETAPEAVPETAADPAPSTSPTAVEDGGITAAR